MNLCPKRKHIHSTFLFSRFDTRNVPGNLPMKIALFPWLRVVIVLSIMVSKTQELPRKRKIFMRKSKALSADYGDKKLLESRGVNDVRNVEDSDGDLMRTIRTFEQKSSFSQASSDSKAGSLSQLNSLGVENEYGEGQVLMSSHTNDTSSVELLTENDSFSGLNVSIGNESASAANIAKGLLRRLKKALDGSDFCPPRTNNTWDDYSENWNNSLSTFNASSVDVNTFDFTGEAKGVAKRLNRRLNKLRSGKGEAKGKGLKRVRGKGKGKGKRNGKWKGFTPDEIEKWLGTGWKRGIGKTHSLENRILKSGSSGFYRAKKSLSVQILRNACESMSVWEIAVRMKSIEDMSGIAFPRGIPDNPECWLCRQNTDEEGKVVYHFAFNLLNNVCKLNIRFRSSLVSMRVTLVFPLKQEALVIGRKSPEIVVRCLTIQPDISVYLRKLNSTQKGAEESIWHPDFVNAEPEPEPEAIVPNAEPEPEINPTNPETHPEAETETSSSPTPELDRETFLKNVPSLGKNISADLEKDEVFLGEYINLHMQLMRNRTDLFSSLAALNVWATPSGDPNDRQVLKLVENGCDADTDTTEPLLGNWEPSNVTVDYQEFTARFQVFRFVNSSSLHLWVELVPCWNETACHMCHNRTENETLDVISVHHVFNVHNRVHPIPVPPDVGPAPVTTQLTRPYGPADVCLTVFLTCLIVCSVLVIYAIFIAIIIVLFMKINQADKATIRVMEHQCSLRAEDMSAYNTMMEFGHEFRSTE